MPSSRAWRRRLTRSPPRSPPWASSIPHSARPPAPSSLPSAAPPGSSISIGSIALENGCRGCWTTGMTPTEVPSPSLSPTLSNPSSL
ncbi:hypothetical protein BHE74_00017689 [Ensete ventricosum]|nr:hypothetical protein GW17_00023099 [Ensete ventricosum]RWW74366.1 hypothetical protein BHE74_00017689 [Ensete ventricosum]RZR99357.1 hypothetical protein BHM03_00028887 [Ensete ventricosum]